MDGKRESQGTVLSIWQWYISDNEKQVKEDHNIYIYIFRERERERVGSEVIL